MRPRPGDLSGAVADLGVFVPLAAALVLVNGVDPGALLVAAGGLALAAGLAFRVPFPVQPLKAMAALAVAQGLDAATLHAAGLLIGVLLVVLAATGSADRLAVLFTRPVIRALQLAVGSLLALAALRLALRPPDLFGDAAGPSTVTLAAVTVAAVAVAAWRRWYAVGAGILAAGTAAAWISGAPDLGTVALRVPTPSLPSPAALWPAFVLLVIPQLPLTYGNAVVGVSDLARQHFGDRARRATPGRVAMSCGLGNVASALLGGMPMCHGSSGLTAHVRLGARTAAMNVVLGSALLVLGLAFSAQVLTLFGLLPVWALAGFLAYAGIRHALLVLDLPPRRLAVAVVAAAAGILTANLVTTTAVALAAEHLPRLLPRALLPRALCAGNHRNGGFLHKQREAGGGRGG